MLSIVIPSRNEQYLQKTILDLLAKAKEEIQVIAILDGYWEDVSRYVTDKRVTYIHYSEPRGMRNAINAGVAIAKGDYILKCDAHCMFSEGYDVGLREFCKDNTVIVPRRWALDPVKWEIDRSNPKYPIDYMYLSKDFHGEPWTERNKDTELEYHVVDDLMSAQGSCWYMKKSYYHELELMDESLYGTFASEFQEVGLKTWLSGGSVLVNKKVWYAHWHKTESRGYSLNKTDGQQASAHVERWMRGEYQWNKQIHDIDWIIEHFAPVPTWQ